MRQFHISFSGAERKQSLLYVLHIDIVLIMSVVSCSVSGQERECHFSAPVPRGLYCSGGPFTGRAWRGLSHCYSLPPRLKMGLPSGSEEYGRVCTIREMDGNVQYIPQKRSMHGRLKRAGFICPRKKSLYLTTDQGCKERRTCSKNPLFLSFQRCTRHTHREREIRRNSRRVRRLDMKRFSAKSSGNLSVGRGTTKTLWLHL